MKTLSVKNFKKVTRTLYNFSSASQPTAGNRSFDGDTTVTTTTLTTSTHFAR